MVARGVAGHAAETDAAPLTPDFFARDAVAVARDLVGCCLLLDGVGGRIVEVEAYTPDDEASHGFRGPTRRNQSMFGSPGRAYVYRSYGVHWCLNLVCDQPGVGAAVLIRSLVAQVGRALIEARRPGVPERNWCRGPGRVGAALAVGPQHDGCRVDQPPFALRERSGPVATSAFRRIGLSRAVDRPWRFVETGSRYVSGPAAAR